MKSSIPFFIALFLSVQAIAQTPEEKQTIQTARAYTQSSEFDDAILVLNRALAINPNSILLQQELAMNYFLKRDYAKAKEVSNALVNNKDADVASFQMAGNVLKALAETKECEKVYKAGLKKFPNSGQLYSEYGELLYEEKNPFAIEEWETGIKKDPSFAGNYYSAALFYSSTPDKIWTIIYGEIFINMESKSDRADAMKELVYKAYKDKILNSPNLLKGEEKNKNEFEKAVLSCLNNQLSLANNGMNTDVLTMIRTRFILEWFEKYAGKFPYKLFDFQKQLLQSGTFNAYNQWLFGQTENPASFQNWVKNNSEEYLRFVQFQQNRIFKMPVGQHYKSK